MAHLAIHGRAGIIHVFDVMEPEVEVDHVPRRRPNPALNLLEASRRRATVDGNAVDVRLALEQFPRGDRIADRDRIADQEDPRQSGNVLNRRQRRVRLLGGPSGRDSRSGVASRDSRQVGRYETAHDQHHHAANGRHLIGF